MAAARRRSAADKATKEAFDQLAQAATGSAPTPEEVEHLKQATDTTAPEAIRIQSSLFESAIRKVTDGLQRKLEQVESAKSKLIELIDKSQSAFKFVQAVSENLQTFSTLAPYINTEADEHPEKYGDSSTNPEAAEDLVKAAAARARADGQDIPFFDVEMIDSEQLEFAIDIPTDKEQQRRQRISESSEVKEKARQNGAIFTASDSYIPIIAAKELGFNYFTSVAIKELPKSIENYVLDEQGRFRLYDLSQEGRPLEDTLKELETPINTALLQFLLSLAEKNDIREFNSNNAIATIFVPDVMKLVKTNFRKWDKETKTMVNKDPGKTPAEQRRDEFLKLISPFLNLAAFFNNSLYQIVGFYGYDLESETAKITIPYMTKLIEYAMLHDKKHPVIVHLFHADIMGENPTAVEVADRIVMGLVTRGANTNASDDRTWNKEARSPARKKTTTTLPDGTKTVEETIYQAENIAKIDGDGVTTTTSPTPTPKKYTYGPIKFSSLIKDCPQLQRELETIRIGIGAAEAEAIKEGKPLDEIKAARRIDHAHDSQRINKKLKDVFTAAIRIIMDKSRVKQYYTDISIRTDRFPKFKPPTNSTLNDKLIITHKGRNPNYID